jgi:hypothetical protein
MAAIDFSSGHPLHDRCCSTENIRSLSLTLFSKAIHKKIHNGLAVELTGIAVLLRQHRREVKVRGNE